MKCPGCGQVLSPNAKGCSKCGAGVKSWSHNENYDGLDLPEGEDFDYEEFVKSEFGESKIKPKNLSWFWWIAGVLVAIAFARLIFGG